MLTYKLIGLSDVAQNCDCCGRKIKRSAVLSTSDDSFPGTDEVSFFGLQCAATALKFKQYKTDKQIKALAENASEAHKQAQQSELIANGSVKLQSGYFLLPNQTLGAKKIDEQLAERNAIYPCFS